MIDTLYYVFYTLQDCQIFSLGFDVPQVNNNIPIFQSGVSMYHSFAGFCVSSDQWS